MTGRNSFFTEVQLLPFPTEHMFKSKTDFNVFDKHHTKVPNLDFKKMKGITKTALKKLAGGSGERTPFHLLIGYFEDASGKPQDHFFDLGIQKRLSRHFKQVEMKPGKPKKRISASPKEAAFGEAYVSVVDGAEVLHLQPDEKTKVIASNWPKVFKKLKPMLNGMQVVIVMNGEEVAVSEASAEEDGISLEQLKLSLGVISKEMKEELSQEIMPRVKSKQATEEDLNAVQGLKQKMETFLEQYKQGTLSAQEELATSTATLEKKLLKLDEIIAYINKILTGATTATDVIPASEEDEKLIADMKAMLKQLEEGNNSFEKKYKRLQPELDKQSRPIPEGTSFLKGMPK